MAESLALVGTTKRFGTHTAIDDLTFEVEPGTFLVLLGPSGSGKSTLVRCLAGIERITSGTIAIGSTVVADSKLHAPPEKRNLSMVFQDYALWPHLTARDNVAAALRRHRIGKEKAAQGALEMLERVGLAGHAGRYPSELSGGEQQRVALARALVGDMGLLLCDEPLSNLDADLREKMRVEISSLVRASGATTVYITHDQAEAFALADRIGVLQGGKLVQLGEPEEVYSRPATPFVARFTGLAGEIGGRIVKAPNGDGTVEVEVTNRSGFRAISARSISAMGAGGEVVLLIRPSGIRLCAPEHDIRHLVGLVTDVAFRGRGYDHAVKLDDGTAITGVFSEVRVERGEPVGLELDPSGCLAFCESPLAGPSPELRAPAGAHANGVSAAT